MSNAEKFLQEQRDFPTNPQKIMACLRKEHAVCLEKPFPGFTPSALELMKVLGMEVMKSKDFKLISKRLDDLESDAITRPMQDAFTLLYQDGVLIPQYLNDMQRGDMMSLAKASSIYRQITTALKWALFRRGGEFKPKFTRKCTNSECGKEFDLEIETCDNCGNPTRMPNYLGTADARKFFKRVNENGDSLIDVCRQCEEDVDTVDDFYICMAKDYFFNANGILIGGVMREIFRIDPAVIFLIADKRFRMGRNEEGKRVFFCTEHRDKLLVERETCPICGKQAFPAFYKAKGEGEPIYYADQEIIHDSKFSPSLTYGFPPFLTLFQKVMIELNMDWYVKKSYEKGRPPNSWVFVKTSNAASLQKMVETVLGLLKKNPHASIPIGIPTDASGQFVQQVKMLDNMAEMQSVEYRNAIKTECGALFQVMPIFQGDLSTSGGLNNEGLQITVTNRAHEVGQALFNDKVFPFITEAFGIQDYVYELLPSEEKDEEAELQRDLLKKQNAKLMVDMGFDVKLNEKNEFEFSGQASRQEMPSFGSPGAPAPKPPSEQRFGGEPASVKRAVKKEAPQAKRMEENASGAEKTLEQTLEDFASALDWKTKPSEAVLRKAVSRLVSKFGERLRKATERELEKIYKKAVDEVEKELQVNIVFGKPDKEALKLLSDSKALTEAYDGMTASVSEKINEVIRNAYEKPEEFTIGRMVERMKEVSDDEEYRLRRIARTETSKVSNTARLNSYSKVDDGTFRYKWIGPNDLRTTNTCKTISSRTKNGVSLEELKAIVLEEAKKTNPEFKTDGTSAHYNCRHTFIKVVS